MSAMYGDVPAGGIQNIPPSIPTGMLYRVKQIQGISKQTLKLVPLSGQISVSQQGKVIVSLPPNSLVDLSTFEMNFTGSTQHRGNGSASNVNNYVQKAYFPRNTASLIENLEIKINGQSRQNINQYGYLYNIFHDYTCGFDSVGKNRIGCNADPSNKTTYINGRPTRYAGYPLGCVSDTIGVNDKDSYTIRQWLGILGGNASTSIIDTSLYGDITIEITLATSEILILSGTSESTALTTGTNAELGLDYIVSTAASLRAAEGTGYTLSDIGFQVTRYDIPQSYYQAVASVLESGAVFKLYYPNYAVFTSNSQSLPKGGTTRFNISTQSLDMVISTFQAPNRGLNQPPILGHITAPAVSSLSTGHYGTYSKSLNMGLLVGWPKTLNNSKYFVRNGDGIKTCTYMVGAVRLIPETIPEQFNGVLRAWNSQNDTLGGLYPGIQSLAHYQTQFYSHILSLNVTNEADMYTVSGLNCQSTPISIGWEVSGSDATSVANVDTSGALSSYGNIFSDDFKSCTPISFACYTSSLHVSAGRNILMFP